MSCHIRCNGLLRGFDNFPRLIGVQSRSTYRTPKNRGLKVLLLHLHRAQIQDSKSCRRPMSSEVNMSSQGIAGPRNFQVA
jgi:hypothetical protein